MQKKRRETGRIPVSLLFGLKNHKSNRLVQVVLFQRLVACVVIANCKFADAQKKCGGFYDEFTASNNCSILEIEGPDFSRTKKGHKRNRLSLDEA